MHVMPPDLCLRIQISDATMFSPLTPHFSELLEESLCAKKVNNPPSTKVAAERKSWQTSAGSWNCPSCGPAASPAELPPKPNPPVEASTAKQHPARAATKKQCNVMAPAIAPKLSTMCSSSLSIRAAS